MSATLGHKELGWCHVCWGVDTFVAALCGLWHIFRPIATKSGRPYGVTSASSSLSCRLPTTTPWPPTEWLTNPSGLTPLAQHYIVTWQYHVMDGRGRLVLTLAKHILFWGLALVWRGDTGRGWCVKCFAEAPKMSVFGGNTFSSLILSKTLARKPRFYPELRP